MIDLIDNSSGYQFLVTDSIVGTEGCEDNEDFDKDHL